MTAAPSLTFCHRSVIVRRHAPPPPATLSHHCHSPTVGSLPVRHKRRPLCACDIPARAPLARRDRQLSCMAIRDAPIPRTLLHLAPPPHPTPPTPPICLWQAGHVGAPVRSQAGRAQAGDASFKRARVVRPRVVRVRAARVRSVHVQCPRGAAAAPLSLGPSPPPDSPSHPHHRGFQGA